MSISKYWINIDELIDSLKGQLEPVIIQKIKSKVGSPFNNCETLIHEIEELLPDKHYVKIIAKIKKLISTRYSGNQQIFGIKKYIPPLKSNFDVIWKVPEEKVNLTGIQLETTGWKTEDCYSLSVKHYNRNSDGGVISSKLVELFHQVPFKEYGEHKVFRSFYNYFGKDKILKDDEVILTFHNKSGNSRQIFLDFEYLIGTAPTVIPPGDTAFFLDTTGSMLPQLQPGSAFYSKLPQYLMDIGANGDIIYTYFFGDTSNTSYEFTYCGSKTAQQTVNFFGDVGNIVMYCGAGCPEAGLSIVKDKYINHKKLENIFIATDCANINDTLKSQWEAIRERGINIFVYIPESILENYKPLEDIDLLKVIGTF